MAINFKNTQHFFVFEKRPTNRLRGKITSHPFACVAIGFEPSEEKLPIRVSASFCHSNSNTMVRAFGANKALGLLHANCEGEDVHVAWFKLSELKNIKIVLHRLGFEYALGERSPEWTRAQKTFKNVLADVQGIRFKAEAPTLKAAKA
jgi:hypothetical protein